MESINIQNGTILALYSIALEAGVCFHKSGPDTYRAQKLSLKYLNL